jgi:hypothetical protein
MTHGSSIIGSVELPSVRVFTKTIEAGLVRQTGSQAEVLVLKHKTCCRSIEQGLIVAPTSHGESERIVGPGESQI